MPSSTLPKSTTQIRPVGELLEDLNYDDKKSDFRKELRTALRQFQRRYKTPNGELGSSFVTWKNKQHIQGLRQMAAGFLNTENNGAKYWPDDKQSPRHNSLQYSKNRTFITNKVVQILFLTNRRRQYYKDKGDAVEGPGKENSGHDKSMATSSNTATANQTMFAGREANTSSAAGHDDPYRIPYSPEATGTATTRGLDARQNAQSSSAEAQRTTPNGTHASEQERVSRKRYADDGSYSGSSCCHPSKTQGFKRRSFATDFQQGHTNTTPAGNTLNTLYIDLTADDAISVNGTNMHLRSRSQTQMDKSADVNTIKTEHELSPGRFDDVFTGRDTPYTDSAFAVSRPDGEADFSGRRPTAPVGQNAEGIGGFGAQGEASNNSTDSCPQSEAWTSFPEDHSILIENQQASSATAYHQAEIHPSGTVPTRAPMAYMHPIVTDVEEEQPHAQYQYGTGQSQPYETANEDRPSGDDASRWEAGMQTDYTATNQGEASTTAFRSEATDEAAGQSLQQPPRCPARPAVEFLVIHSKCPFWKAQSWVPRGKFMRTSLPELIQELPPAFVDALNQGAGLKFIMRGINTRVEEPIVHGDDYSFEAMKAQTLKEAYKKHQSMTDTGNFGIEQVPPFTIQIEVLGNHFMPGLGTLDESEKPDDDIC